LSAARIKVVVAPLVAILVTFAAVLGGCGSAQPSPIVSPRPAVSVTALPGLSKQDRKADVAAYHETGLRVIQVFIKDGTPRVKKEAMAKRIAAMPEVVAYHFITKREALRQFKERFGAKIVENLPPRNPFPASFELLVRDLADVIPVAERFKDDPIVDNDPGTHNGVKRAADPLLEQAASSP
jgi:hypothetical protein